MGFKEDVFCAQCEQLIGYSLFGKLQGHRFAKGTYCMNCAQSKVRAARA